MNCSEDSDPIDALLHEQNAYIEDNGFTSRVIKALPRRRHAWLRAAILLGASVIGFALAILWLPWNSLPPLDSSALLSLNSEVLSPWLLVFSVVASLAWALVNVIQCEDRFI